MKKLTNDQINEIISRYQQGDSPINIAKDFGIFNNSVTRILRKKGIERNQLERVSEKDIKIIIEKYKSGISSEIIANELNICGSTVCRILKRNNIEIRPAEENKRKYDINENYFESIDNEKAAYFLGFLYADGNLTKNGHGIKITLHIKDKDILEKFSNEIYGFVKTSKNSKDNERYESVHVYSNKMHSDLQKLGCGPCKTFNIRFDSNFIREDLVRHFIRGYFDGDGCICLKDKHRPVLDFTSNKSFIDDIREYLETKLGIIFNKIQQRHEESDTRTLQLTSFDQVKKLLDYMYLDSNIYMNRKYNLYIEFLQALEYKQNVLYDKQCNIKKYGTTYIPTYKENILNSTYLKTIDNLEKEQISEYLFSFYRKNGFPFPFFSNDELIKDFSVLKSFDVNRVCSEDNILNIFHAEGLNIFKHFSHHFFNIKSGLDKRRPSMIDAFYDDEILKKLIVNRLSGNYNMTGNMIRQGLSTANLAFKGSSFFPTIAKFIYSKYTEEGDLIYDYSMGYGQRLLGALSLPYKVKYIGVDPLEKTVESNNNIFSFLNGNIPFLNKEVDIINDGSENFCKEQYIGKVKLAFSSPPYYNQEIYEEATTQSYYNTDYISFINKWWRNVAKNIDKLLREDGIFAINIKDELNGFNLSEDMRNIMRELNFTLIDTYRIQLSKNTEFRNKTKDQKYEPIYVFKKYHI